MNEHNYFLEKWSKGAGDGDDDGDNDDDGRIFPEHPSPILPAPRDNISRKGKSLLPIMRDIMWDIVRDVQTWTNHYSMRRHAVFLLYSEGCG